MYLALESSSPPEPGADRTMRSPMPALAKIITFTNHMATMSTPAPTLFLSRKKTGKTGGREIKAKPRPLLFFYFFHFFFSIFCFSRQLTHPKMQTLKFSSSGKKKKKSRADESFSRDGCSPVKHNAPVAVQSLLVPNPLTCAQANLRRGSSKHPPRQSVKKSI